VDGGWGDWEGPHTIPASRFQKTPEAKGDGTYAIYEMHGRQYVKLLYIGETFSQTFGQRLKQHERTWLQKVNVAELAVCFGTVYFPYECRRTSERIHDIESFLINAKAPPYNNVSKRGYTGRHILIFNAGEIGLLQPIMTDDDELMAVLKSYL